MAWLMACAFGLVACYTLGILCRLYAPLTLPLLTVATIAVPMVCRFYAVPPPGSLFFVMAARLLDTLVGCGIGLAGGSACTTPGSVRRPGPRCGGWCPGAWEP